MKVKTIAVTYGRKMNLGDYNSVHAEVTLWIDLEEGESEEAAVLGARQMARNNVMQELGRNNQKLAAKLTDAFMGLPMNVQKELE